MDVSLPSSVERFLDRAVRALKGYNLNKRKEQYVIAKLIDEHQGGENKNVDNPYAFLSKLREAEKNALNTAQNNSEHEGIQKLFKHVDMPGLELPEKK